jgi:hypothetical protein
VFDGGERGDVWVLLGEMPLDPRLQRVLAPEAFDLEAGAEHRERHGADGRHREGARGNAGEHVGGVLHREGRQHR